MQDNKKRRRKKKTYLRAHPYTVLTYLSRFTYLLIIPLLQHLLFQPQNLAETIATAGVNILFVLLILFTAVGEYQGIVYRYNVKGIYLRRGWFIKRTSTVPAACIQSVSIQKNIFPALFGAVRVHIDTPGAIRNKSDISLVLSRRKTRHVIDRIFEEDDVSILYKSSFLRILVMAATWSNSITGLLIFAPFINRVGTVLGEEFSAKLYEGINLGVYLAAIGLPPVAAYIAGILVFGYIVAYLVQVFRYGRFSVSRTGSRVIINRGLISRNTFITETEHINAVSARQSILMLLFRLKSVYIHTIGSGKAKGDKSLLIAAQSSKTIDRVLMTLSGRTLNFQQGITPPKHKAKSFLYLPAACILCVIPAAVLLSALGLYGEILILMLLFGVPVLFLWLGFRFLAYKKTALAYNGKAVMACGFKRMNLTQNAVPYEKVQYLVIKQSLFQKFSHSCHVTVYIYSDHRQGFTVKNLDYKEACDTVEEIEAYIREASQKKR